MKDQNERPEWKSTAHDPPRDGQAIYLGEFLSSSTKKSSFGWQFIFSAYDELELLDLSWNSRSQTILQTNL